MDKSTLKDRSIQRKQPKMNPLRKLFVHAATNHANRSKRQPPTLASVKFTKESKDGKKLGS
jgi:hypothetical protein